MAGDEEMADQHMEGAEGDGDDDDDEEEEEEMFYEEEDDEEDNQFVEEEEEEEDVEEDDDEGPQAFGNLWRHVVGRARQQQNQSRSQVWASSIIALWLVSLT